MKKGFLLIGIGLAIIICCRCFLDFDDGSTGLLMENLEVQNTGVTTSILDFEHNEDLFSPDRYANEVISEFNEQNPDTPVSHQMIETWTTGGGEATLVTFDDYCMQFGHVDGYATFMVFSDQEESEKTRNVFIKESTKWAKAIFTGTFLDVGRIINRASESNSIEQTELKYNYINYDVHFEENEEDYYQKRHTYIIKISPRLR